MQGLGGLLHKVQVLLVLINKGRLCIYFCSLVHRSSLGDQDVSFCRLRGKLMRVLPSGVSYSPSFSVPDTPTHLPQVTGWGQGDRAPSVTVTSPRRPASPSSAPSSMQHRTMLQTLGNEGVKMHFTMSNCYPDYTGIPTGTPTGRSQHIPTNRKIDGRSRRGAELERSRPTKSKNSNTVPARAIFRGHTIYTGETQAPVG